MLNHAISVFLSFADDWADWIVVAIFALFLAVFPSVMVYLEPDEGRAVGRAYHEYFLLSLGMVAGATMLFFFLYVGANW